MPVDVPVDEALAPSLCVSVEVSLASGLPAVVVDASLCKSDTKSGVCDSGRAMCELDVSPSAIVLPAVPDEASSCVASEKSGVCDSSADVVEADSSTS